MTANEGASCLFELVAGRLKTQIKFIATIWCELNGMEQLASALTRNAEQVHNLSIKIIIDLGEASRLRKQYRSRAAVWLDVNAMLREKTDYPSREPPFAAVVSEHRT